MLKTSLVGNQIIDLIAKQSSLSEKQVKECFQTYRLFIDKIVENSNAENVKISIPYLGSFIFKEKKGLKKGREIRIPFLKDSDGKVLTKILEEDRPDYFKLYFEVKPEINKKLKEISSERFLRKKNSIYKDRSKV